MKLVATSNFRAPTGVEIMFEKNSPHPLHVGKGARFSIGGDTPLEKLPHKEQRIIAELNRSGRIVNAENVDAVAAIDAELAAETITETRIREGSKPKAA